MFRTLIDIQQGQALEDSSSYARFHTPDTTHTQVARTCLPPVSQKTIKVRRKVSGL